MTLDEMIQVLTDARRLCNAGDRKVYIKVTGNDGVCEIQSVALGLTDPVVMMWTDSPVMFKPLAQVARSSFEGYDKDRDNPLAPVWPRS